MSLFIIVRWGCCADYQSAWTTEERANEECRALNAEYFRNYGREPFEVIASHLNA
jgi:hypothetical protein